MTNRFGTAELASLLRQDILSQAIKFGERLPPERIIQQRYEVARGTVRNALLQLTHEGLVETRQGSGTYVTFQPPKSDKMASDQMMDNISPLELIDVRFALEAHICRLAVLHGKKEQFQQAEDQLNMMEDALEDAVRFAAADKQFHIILAECTGNSLLVFLTKMLSQARNQDEWAKMRQLILNPNTIDAYNMQHRMILDAIRNRNPKAASLAMQHHLEEARLALTRASST